LVPAKHAGNHINICHSHPPKPDKGHCPTIIDSLSVSTIVRKLTTNPQPQSLP
jgi:hypothetical protein